MSEIGDLARKGLIKPFMAVVKEVVKESEVKFDKNPYVNAYNLGKAEMAEEFAELIESKIEELANE